MIRFARFVLAALLFLLALAFGLATLGSATSEEGGVTWALAAVGAFIGWVAWRVWPGARTVQDESQRVAMMAFTDTRDAIQDALRPDPPAPRTARPTRSESAPSPPNVPIHGRTSTDTVSPAPSSERWIPPGEAVTIAGMVVPGGMIYVGSPRGGSGPWRSTIDPKARVARSDPDRHCHLMPYWPSYSEIDPRSRLAYLQWLAGGRSDPEVGIGHVFLFFYGLERRLFVDEKTDEVDALCAEVERLRTIYGDNHSFRRYSNHFLNAARTVALIGAGNGSRPSPPEPTLESDWEMPLELRVGLGRQIADGQPLTADWMLAWYLGHPETRLRVPAKRAFPEFCELFRIRFAEKFPKGLRVTRPKKTLKAEYRAASGEFSAHIKADLPDVISLRKPVNDVASIAERCMDELAAYSRVIGKDPAAAETIQAAALLPPELRHKAASDAAREFSDYLRSLTGGLFGSVPARELLRRLELQPGASDRLTKTVLRSLAGTLEAFGYGFEPDPAFGSPAPRITENLVVFELPENRSTDGAFGHAYGSAMSVLMLTAAVAHADGTMDDDEARHVLRSIRENVHLGAYERARLTALAAWMILTPPSFGELKKQLKGAPADARHALARYAIAAAAADDHVDNAEVKLLEKVYGLLDLDTGTLYSDLHALQDSSGPDEAPVAVKSETPGAPGFAIPRPETSPPLAGPDGTITLDHDRVSRIRNETDVVAGVLAGIFVQDGEPEDEPEPAPETTDVEDETDGLDRRHAALLDELLAREEWPREDFEALCRTFDLLPDGAMETINEWSFDRFDEALIEDGDPLTVHRATLHSTETEAHA